MENRENSLKAAASIGRVTRKLVRISEPAPQESACDVRPDPLPLIVTPTGGTRHLESWAAAHRTAIDDGLRRHGAVLLRRFHVGGIDAFRDVVNLLGGDVERYTYRSTPRTEIGNGVYTSTEYPAAKSIPFHNENSYATRWPRWLFFYCELPSLSGGETPIADSFRVFDRIPAEVRDRFIAKRVMYVRNYGEGVDLPWQEVFQTANRGEVERFCTEHDIQIEWGKGDRLRTRQVCQAIARHPDNGRIAWFNQAHLFHVSSLDADVRTALLDVFSEDELPRNALYGAGSPIPLDDLESVRRAYALESVQFAWEKEDLLVVDNIAVAHSRRPFTGPRKIRVAMTQSIGAEVVA